MQLYKCAACGRQFLDIKRISSAALLAEFLQGMQTYGHLAVAYQCCDKTIQRKLDNARVQRNTTFPAPCNVLMDTTYYGRKFGVIVFKDSISGHNLYKQYVK